MGGTGQDQLRRLGNLQPTVIIMIEGNKSSKVLVPSPSHLDSGAFILFSVDIHHSLTLFQVEKHSGGFLPLIAPVMLQQGI